jgi:hypothetical protein
VHGESSGYERRIVHQFHGLDPGMLLSGIRESLLFADFRSKSGISSALFCCPL